MFAFNVKEGVYLEHLRDIEALVEKLGEDFNKYKEDSSSDSEFWETHEAVMKSIKVLKGLIDQCCSSSQIKFISILQNMIYSLCNKYDVYKCEEL